MRQGDTLEVVACPAMAVLSTDFLARRTHHLAEMIQTLPASARPDHQVGCCRELLVQLGEALDRLAQPERTA
jgi:hypothetical protein